MASKIIELNRSTEQLDLFPELKATPIEKKINAHDKQIRGLYSRYNELEFVVLEFHKKIERMSEVVFKHV